MFETYSNPTYRCTKDNTHRFRSDSAICLRAGEEPVLAPCPTCGQRLEIEGFLEDLAHEFDDSVPPPQYVPGLHRKQGASMAGVLAEGWRREIADFMDNCKIAPARHVQ